MYTVQYNFKCTSNRCDIDTVRPKLIWNTLIYSLTTTSAAILSCSLKRCGKESTRIELETNCCQTFLSKMSPYCVVKGVKLLHFINVTQCYHWLKYWNRVLIGLNTGTVGWLVEILEPWADWLKYRKRELIGWNTGTVSWLVEILEPWADWLEYWKRELIAV